MADMRLPILTGQISDLVVNRVVNLDLVRNLAACTYIYIYGQSSAGSERDIHDHIVRRQNIDVSARS